VGSLYETQRKVKSYRSGPWLSGITKLALNCVRSCTGEKPAWSFHRLVRWRFVQKSQIVTCRKSVVGVVKVEWTHHVGRSEQSIQKQLHSVTWQDGLLFQSIISADYHSILFYMMTLWSRSWPQCELICNQSER